MENMYYDVETDSTLDNVINPSDHADARAPDNVGEPILAGSLNVLTSGLQTDADARQAVAPDAGQRTEGFELLDYPAAVSPVQPLKLRLAASPQSSQRWIRAGARTMVRIHWCPEPCLWTKVVTAQGSLRV